MGVGDGDVSVGDDDVSVGGGDVGVGGVDVGVGGGVRVGATMAVVVGGDVSGLSHLAPPVRCH